MSYRSDAGEYGRSWKRIETIDSCPRGCAKTSKMGSLWIRLGVFVRQSGHLACLPSVPSPVGMKAYLCFGILSCTPESRPCHLLQAARNSDVDKYSSYAVFARMLDGPSISAFWVCDRGVLSGQLQPYVLLRYRRACIFGHPGRHTRYVSMVSASFSSSVCCIQRGNNLLQKLWLRLPARQRLWMGSGSKYVEHGLCRAIRVE